MNPISLLVSTIGSSEEYCTLIEKAILPAESAECATALNALLQKLGHGPRKEILSDLVGWCKSNRQSDALRDALKRRDDVVKKRKSLHKLIVHTLFLKPDKSHQGDFLAALSVVNAAALPESYPPLGYWVSETQEIYDQWVDHIKHAPQPDKRLKRKPMMIIEPHQLCHDISPDQSVKIMDGERLVAMVVREFCAHLPVLRWAEAVVAEGVEKKKSARVRAAHLYSL
jgi:hypothetical protein